MLQNLIKQFEIRHKDLREECNINQFSIDKIFTQGRLNEMTWVLEYLKKLIDIEE